MKNILKLAVAFLLIFAMIGMASATVGNLWLDSVTASGDNTYTVVWKWDGTPNGNYVEDGITINGAFDQAAQSYTLSSVLQGSTYTLSIKDDDAATVSILTSILDSSATDLKTTGASTDVAYTISLANEPAGSTLQIFNNNVWENLTDGDVLSSTASSFKYRFVIFDETNTYYVSMSPESTIEFKPISITTPNGADLGSDFINWKFTGVSDWEGAEYKVLKKSDLSEVTAGSLIAETNFNATSLTADDEYIFKIRGVDTTHGYGLWVSNGPIQLADVPIDFISSIEPAKNYNPADGSDQVVSTENATTFYLNVTAKGEVNFVWELKFDNKGSWTTVPSGNYTVDNSSDKLKSNFSWKPSNIGTYNLSLKMSDVNDGDKNQTIFWTITVTEKTTGNRIWKEGMPDPYTWDARSFSGFYYNLDTGEGDESMIIKGMSSGRSIEKGNITYTTTASETEYSYSAWNNYKIVGFMGDKYFAGDDKSSLMKNGNLSKVLLDNDDKVQLRTGSYYALEEGYSIYVNQIDLNGNKAQIAFYKDGKEIDSTLASNGQDVEYYKNIGSGSGNNTTIIKTRLKSVFQGTESSIVELEGFFQISENLTRLESGTRIGKMEIKSVSSDKIVMENDERISLSQDSTVDLMGKVKLLVADSGTLRFAPIMEYTDPGVYEIRGTVSDYGKEDYIVKKWNPENFEGFYYDINDDVNSAEIIEIKQENLSNESRSIEKGNLTYSSSVTAVKYNYSAWGEYSVVGFMGEKYYAGLGGSLLKDGNLSKVLIDADEKRDMRLGDSLTLEDGISIKIEQIDTNGNKARLLVEQNGKELYSEIVPAGGDLVYNGSNSKIKDTPFIKIHVSSVFMGTESSIVSVSGIFQASMNLTKLETDTKYGKMKVNSYTSTGISLSSDERITLSEGGDVDFMKVGNETMYFKVGDNSTLRFAPVVERTIGSTDPLTVKLNSSNVTSGDTVLITLNDRGTTIEGVTVYVNGSQIGTTNSSGEITYKTSAVGSFKVTGEKTGFVNGSATLNVAEKLINMTVRVSPETVYFGTPATIKATDSLNGSALSGATVYVSGESVGTTDSSGELNYTFNKTGSITVDVSKSGYNNGTKTVDISQKVAFAYGNFTLKPNEPSAKKAIKLSIDIANNGIEDGSHDLSLILTDTDGNIIDQDNSSVSVKVGKSKSVTLSVKAPEEGAYKMILKEADSNRTIDLPSNMSTISVGEAKFGSTILYVILGGIGMIVIVVIGIVAYLFGIKGATTSNYKEVAGELTDDIKSKFNKK